MRYTKEAFSADLKRILNNSSEPIEVIAKWAYTTRLSHLEDIDPEVSSILERLGFMEMGPEFEYSIEELRSLAELSA